VFDEKVSILQIFDKPADNYEVWTRIGIAQRNIEGKPHFIHRTFAEFYVAEFLIKQLQKKEIPNKEVQELLLNEVLLEPDYRVIRAFLDGMLGNSTASTEVLKGYGKKFNEQWNAREAQGPPTGVTTAIFQAASENNANIIGFIADSLKSAGCSNTVTEIVFSEDDQGRNVFDMAGENRALTALKKTSTLVSEVLFVPGSSLPLSQNRHQ
jgi:hypothetical protein